MESRMCGDFGDNVSMVYVTVPLCSSACTNTTAAFVQSPQYQCVIHEMGAKSASLLVHTHTEKLAWHAVTVPWRGTVAAAVLVPARLYASIVKISHLFPCSTLNE